VNRIWRAQTRETTASTADVTFRWGHGAARATAVAANLLPEAGHTRVVDGEEGPLTWGGAEGI
jgi:hypothetical protein